jgi:hypothetical protein
MPFNVGGHIYNGEQTNTQDYYNIITRGSVWHLDASAPSSYPTTGTTWSDISGNNFTANLVNGPTFTTNNEGGIVFDGSNDYASGSNFNINTNEFTLEAWIKPTNVNSNYGIVVKPTENYFWPCYSMWMDGKNLYGYYSSAVYGQCLEGAYGTGNPISTNNAWYHVAFSKGTAGYTTMALYVNGVASSYNNFLYGSHINTLATSTVPTWFAVTNDTNVLLNYFNGTIGSIRIYSRQLSAAEMLQNFNVQRSRFGI